MKDKIILYSTNCTYCRQLKMLLDYNQIRYAINSDEEYMISEGFTSLPVLEVNGQRMNFHQASEWVNIKKDGVKDEG